MKKFFPIIIGVATGLAISVAMIGFNISKIAYGDDTETHWWNDTVAAVDTFEWEDVWEKVPIAAGLSDDSEDPYNLYNLIYGKLQLKAEDDALKILSSQYGLTTNEGKAVLGGSIIPIFNNPDRSSAKLTSEDAAKIMNAFQDDYRFLKELFQIQQEVDTSIGPSEMFANGDISDSGFDLVYDLSVIEEILFLDKTPSSTGAPYKDAQDSPYNPTLEQDTYADYVAASSDDTLVTHKAALSVPEENQGVITIGDQELEVEILDEDVCPSEDSLGDALDNKEQEDAQGAAGADLDEGGAGGDGGDGGDDNKGAGDDDDDDKDDKGGGEGAGKADEIKPADADEWIQAWCPGLDMGSGAAGADATAGAGLPPGGLNSLGGVTGSFLQAGAATGIDTAGFSTAIGVCFDTKLVMKTVSSYYPGASCIQCEVEKINEFLEKTLSHTLIPSKVSGNLMESAKCKNTKASGFNMQIITIWNPVPTPPNDDLIFGKNIFEEWNKFVKRYQPVLMGKASFPDAKQQDPQASEEFLSEQQQKHASSNLSQSELAAEIAKKKAQYTSEANKSVGDFNAATDSTNIMLYSRNVLSEMKQMNALFNAFKTTFNKIDEDALKVIKQKPDVQ